MFLRGNIYYADYYFKGKRYRPSLHTSDYAEAVSREKVFIHFLNEEQIGPKEITLWKDFKRWYLWYLKENRTEGTIYIHCMAIKLLEEYRTPYYLRKMTPEFLLKFKVFLYEKYQGKCSAGRNRYIKALKAMMHTAELFGKIGIKQNWELVKKDDENENRLEYHDPLELSQIKGALCGDLLTAFLLGCEQGLRRGEMAFLYKKDYNPSTHTISISRKKEWKPKTKKSIRTIPLHPNAEAAIQASIANAPAESPYIINLSGNRQKYGYISSAYIRETKRKFPHLHCYLHKLRHTFGSLLVQQGVHLKTICDLMGHSNILQTEKYVHLGSKQYISAINCLPEI